MRLNLLSTLVLAAVVASGAVGCKKRMDRVTPLPGYGAGGTIRDPGSDLSRTPSGDQSPVTPPPTGQEMPSVPPVDPNQSIPLSGKRDITGRDQDRTRFAAQTVYFDFDRSTVRAAEASKVQEVATQFRAENPESDLLIEGHCDERGTEGYNMALGERRALSIRELLVSLGVPSERIHTVSFGKDRPADPGHNEAAWSKNRRAEFILVLPRK